MVSVLVTVTVYQLSEELKLSPGQSVSDKLSSMALDGKSNTITKSFTVKDVSRIEKLFTLENLQELVEKSGQKGFPNIRAEVTYTTV
jgi:hypothetical protein